MVTCDDDDLASRAVWADAGEFCEHVARKQHETNAHLWLFCKVSAVDDKRWIPLNNVIYAAYESSCDVNSALVLSRSRDAAVSFVTEVGVR